MIQPRYVLSTPSLDEHRRWVDQRLAELTTQRKRRRRK
jgi:hypothetical protein